MISHSPEGRARRRSISIVLTIITLWSGTRSLHATAPLYERDLAIFDRALATGAKPGEKWIRFGDVGITPERLREFRDRLAEAARGAPDFVTPGGTAFQWPGGNVYYRFNPAQVSNGTITPAKMQQFRDGAAEWAGWANLTFVESIAGQPNYITVREDPGLGGGFSSSVGLAGGEQFVDFDPQAWNRGTICHEVGHALGLWHEQQRTDRDTYVIINFTNIAPGDQPNFVIIPDSTSHNAYDFFSVMHYDRTTLAINPNVDTIIMQPGYAQFADIIGRVFYRTLSKLDRKGMAEVYGDPSPLPGAVVINTKESGRGSLRNAIYYAFDRSTDVPSVPTTVAFNIPLIDPGFAGGVFTIQPTYLMVAPGAGTTIDGATQTTFTGNTNANGPEIVLDGSQMAAQNLNLFAPGFLLLDPNCAIRNLVIHGFNQQGIHLQGAAATGNVISGCYIGTDATGGGAVPNNFPGIEISGGAHANTIGGTTAAARNVISGGSHFGVSIFGSGSNGNLVRGNYLGTNAAGTVGLGNAFAGVGIYGGAQANVVGGASAGAGNVISGNGSEGIAILDPGTDGNFVQGNFIGTNAAGTGALSNNFAGVGIFNGAAGNLIGGVSATARNVISGNAREGVVIGQANSNGNFVQGNFIGTTAAGTTALANNFAGVTIFGGAQLNRIGGTAAAARNVISGNGNQGVVLAGPGTNGNVIQGNHIGVNAAGAAAIGNTFAGVSIFDGAQANQIGGSTPGARNVISGNGGQGATVSGTNTDGNSIQGNYFGLNAGGTTAIANAGSGIDVFGGAQNNTIGGTAPGARNLIAGNSAYGVSFSSSGTNSNFVQGNTIGLNVLGSPVANGFQGVALFGGAQSNIVGGSALGASNLIAGNNNEGVALFDLATNENTISRNSIFGNNARGIGLYTNSNNNQTPPVLSSAVLGPAGNLSGTDVSGTLSGSGAVSFHLEFFANPSGEDEGRTFIGTANRSGGAAFSVSLPAAVPGNYLITATATDPDGNTSEFSLTQVVTTTDTDGDGIPDAYETSNGLNANVNDAALDKDGDGTSNLQEFQAGTDPQNATSRFRITAVTKSADDISITFASIAGKTYRIEWKGDLALPNWTLLSDQVVATGASTQIIDAGVGALPRRFYSAVVEP